MADKKKKPAEDDLPELSPHDRELLIRTVIGEAEGEPPVGQAAVAHVILNRLKTKHGGKSTLEGIVKAPKQFEAWTAGRDRMLNASPETYNKVAQVVDNVLAGAEDPTGGATHFLNEDIVRQRRGGSLPSWASRPGLRIGNHTFHGGLALGQGDAQTAISRSLGQQPDGGDSSALAFAGGDGAPDLLGSWTPKGSAPAAAPAARPGFPAEGGEGTPDLLGSWAVPATPAGKTAPAKAAEPPASAPAQPAAATTVAPAGPAAEMARLAAENQGPGAGAAAMRTLAGVGRGMGDVADTLATGIVSASDKAAEKLVKLGVISPESAGKVSKWRQEVDERIAAGKEAFKEGAKDSLAADIGRIGGQVVGTGPFLAAGGAALPAAVRGGLAMRTAAPGAGMFARAATAAGNLERAAVAGAGAGAGAAALTSAANEEPLADQMLQGAAVGGALRPAGRVLAKAGGKVAELVTGGKVDPQIAQLADEAYKKFGIKLSATQISDNKMVRFLDSVLQRMPFSGFGARTAEQSAAFHKALAAEMGTTADRITKDVIDQTKGRLGKAYDLINQNWGPIATSGGFTTKLSRIERDTEFKKIKNIVDDIRKHIDPKTGTISGDDFAFLTRHESPLAKALGSADGALVQDAKAIAAELNAVAKKANPRVYAWKEEADYKYAVAKALEAAAEKSTTGQLSFPAVWSAFKDWSTKGNPRKIGAIGETFLKEPASSGTFERYLAGSAAAVPFVGAAALGATQFDPENLQTSLLKGAGLAGAALAARYGVSPWLRSEGVAQALINRSLGRPASGKGQKFSDLLARTAVPAAALTYRGN